MCRVAIDGRPDVTPCGATIGRDLPLEAGLVGRCIRPIQSSRCPTSPIDRYTGRSRRKGRHHDTGHRGVGVNQALATVIVKARANGYLGAAKAAGHPFDHVNGRVLQDGADGGGGQVRVRVAHQRRDGRGVGRGGGGAEEVGLAITLVVTAEEGVIAPIRGGEFRLLPGHVNFSARGIEQDGRVARR